MQDNNIIQNTFTGGLNWDDLPEKVSPNEYQYALNAVLENLLGNQGGLTADTSNEQSYQFGFPVIKILGHAHITSGNKDEVVLALMSAGTGQIGIFNAVTNSYNSLISGPELNFHENYPINMLIKIKNGTERILYLTDDRNPLRVINLDKISEYYAGATLLPNRLLFSPSITLPTSFNTEITTGGYLSLGTYRVYAKYVGFDLNETSVIATSQLETIFKSSENDNFFAIDGGYNIATSSSAVAGEQYPRSNKSIKCTIVGADNTFKYIQFYVVQYIAGSGAIGSIVKSPLISISDNNATWTYNGLNALSEGNENDIITDSTIIRKVKAIAQKDNYLFLGNMEESQDLDYGAIQRAALNISVKWEVEPKPKFDTKKPLSYQTYMRDEIYALGIRGIKLDGSSTPVFHIPGRNAQTLSNARVLQGTVFSIDENYFTPGIQDTTLVTPVTGEFEHLTQYVVGGQVPLWRLVNTSWVDNTTVGGGWQGTMAYWESNEVYPTINTPSGLLYGALTGTPIRHHKMPDTNKIVHVDNNNVYPLFLNIDLNLFTAALPTSVTSVVQKWEIVQVERTEDTKTVLDKGITTFDECNRGGNMGFTTQGVQIEPEVVRFYSPQMLFKKKRMSPTHYKPEWYNSYRDIRTLPSNYSRQYKPVNWITPTSDTIRELYDWTGQTNTDVVDTTGLSNLSITDSSYVSETGLETSFAGAATSYVLGKLNGINNPWGVANLNFTPHVFHFRAFGGRKLNQSDGIVGRALLTYGALKVEADVYANLELLTYLAVENESLAGGIVRVKGQDSFITPMQFVITSYVSTDDPFLSNSLIGTFQEYVHDVYFQFVESDLNTGLRHEYNTFNKLDGQSYFHGWLSLNNALVRIEHNINTSTLVAGTIAGYEVELNKYSVGLGDLWRRDNASRRLFRQALLLNNDFNYQHSIKPYITLANNYDYSLYLKESRAYSRIRYSQKDFQESKIDAYRQMLANNYIDQDQQYGEITDLFVDKNDLYSRTYKSLLKVPTNVQTIKGNDTLIYLGKAELIPYEPKAASTLSFSYGGGYNFTHRVTTEYGTVLLDIYTNRVFLLREGLQDLGENMFSFMDNHMKWDLLDYNVDYKKNNALLYYDTWRKRLLITFRNYKFKNTLFQTNVSGKVPTYNENTDTIDILIGAAVGATYNIGDIASLEEFTISFSFKTMKWTSFHSFTPEYAFNLKKGFGALYNTQGFYAMYKHFNKHINDGDPGLFPYLFYSGILYPFVIETTLNKGANTVKILNALGLYTINPNWTRMQVYTDKQHTGVQLLTVRKAEDNLLQADIYKTVISQKEDYYNINRIIDKVTDATVPVWTKYDKLNNILNTININTTNVFKPYQGAIRGQWIKVRLEFDPIVEGNKQQGIWLLESSITPVNR
jgi:hypothetical protein